MLRERVKILQGFEKEPDTNINYPKPKQPQQYWKISMEEKSSQYSWDEESREQHDQERWWNLWWSGSLRNIRIGMAFFSGLFAQMSSSMRLAKK